MTVDELFGITKENVDNKNENVKKVENDNTNGNVLSSKSEDTEKVENNFIEKTETKIIQ